MGIWSMCNLQPTVVKLRRFPRFRGPSLARNGWEGQGSLSGSHSASAPTVRSTRASFRHPTSCSKGKTKHLWNLHMFPKCSLLTDLGQGSCSFKNQSSALLGEISQVGGCHHLLQIHFHDAGRHPAPAPSYQLRVLC